MIWIWNQRRPRLSEPANHKGMSCDALVNNTRTPCLCHLHQPILATQKMPFSVVNTISKACPCLLHFHSWNVHQVSRNHSPVSIILISQCDCSHHSIVTSAVSLLLSVKANSLPATWEHLALSKGGVFSWVAILTLPQINAFILTSVVSRLAF